MELVRKSKLKKQNDLSVAQNALSALLVNRDALQFWPLGFQEIRFQTMSEVIERWNALFCQEVNYLGCHPDSTRLEVKGLQSSKRPEVDIVITRSGGDLQLEALSDGELRRVDLAAFLSLRQITIEYLGYNLELIVWDEPTNGSDEQGRECMWERLISLGGQQFVIDHQATFIDRFENVLMVSKDKDSSTVVVDRQG
ncbi:MAG: hypothetical protein M3461_19020 [Pseudomonadota bacterium]|nr:hypothetical protein [Pseudomonadota bacterium]